VVDDSNNGVDGDAWRGMVAAVDVAQLFLEGPSPADSAVGADYSVDQCAFVVGEFVLNCA
jgi:hypothetical protein